MRNLCLLLVKLFSTDLVSKNHRVILDEEKPWSKPGVLEEFPDFPSL
jgi:hypothetical protein